MSKKLSLLIAAIFSVGTHVAVAATTAEKCLTDDQTWTPPPGLTTIKRLVVVGGGAAGGADAAGNFGPGGQNAPNGGATAGSGWGAGGGGGVGAGGGQAGLVNEVANVAVTGPVAVKVGKGGTTAGTKGGQTCFGTTCANGGDGGGIYNDFSPVSGGQAGWGGTDGAGTQTAPTQELGTVQVGGTSAAKTITVVNNSPLTTTFQNISPPSGLTVTSDNCSGQPIGPLSSCTFNLAVAPTAQGDFSKNLEVNTGRGKLIIPVHATATPPALQIVTPTTTPVDFASQDATAVTVTVKNSGSMALTLGALTMGGTNASAFSVSAGTCTSGASIAANGTCNFTVSFAPTAAGTFSGTAQLAVTGGTTLTVGTTGTAALKNLTASATTVDFGMAQLNAKSTKTVTVTNPNKWAVAMTPAIASGGTYYTVESNSCSGSVPAGGTCTVTVGFNPGATTTAQTGALDITF